MDKLEPTAFMAFFGDHEQRFCLTAACIVELEKATGAGIGMLFKRIAAGMFYRADLAHTIRLGLIGGGATPLHATRYCESYFDPRPIAEVLPLALAILERLWLGADAATALKAEMKAAADA